MKDIKSNFRNVILCLVVILSVLSVLLAMVYMATLEPIQKIHEETKNAAIQNVIPSFDKLETMRVPIRTEIVQNIFKKEQAKDSLTVYKATYNGEWVGTAVETFTDKGFETRIMLMVGFLPDGTIQKIEVLKQNETPGLGDKIDIKKSNFPLQFIGKNPKDFKLVVRREGGDVDAITGATISSRAYCDAVIKAYNVFESVFINNNGGKSDE